MESGGSEPLTKGKRDGKGPNGGQSRSLARASERTALLHKVSSGVRLPQISLVFYLQNDTFHEWAMLGSNQRPLPCEGSAIVCWRVLDLAKSLQITVFLRRRISQLFRRFTRVAARLLHKCQGL